MHVFKSGSKQRFLSSLSSPKANTENGWKWSIKLKYCVRICSYFLKTLAYTPPFTLALSLRAATRQRDIKKIRQVTDENAKKQIDLKRSQHRSYRSLPNRPETSRNHMDRQVISDVNIRTQQLQHLTLTNMIIIPLFWTLVPIKAALILHDQEKY